jgi:hypothetical protein
MIKRILSIALCCILLLTVGLAGFAIGLLTLGGYSPNMLLELVSGQTPQAKIRAYLEAIQAQNREAALAAWLPPDSNSASFPALSERRTQVTDELLARQINGFTIFEPEWWRTCCEPGVTCQAHNAGGARVRVQVLDAQGKPWQYVFDVFTQGVYFGAAEGNPYRRWQLRDIYPWGEAPIFWTFTSVVAPCP